MPDFIYVDNWVKKNVNSLYRISLEKVKNFPIFVILVGLISAILYPCTVRKDSTSDFLKASKYPFICFPFLSNAIYLYLIFSLDTTLLPETTILLLKVGVVLLRGLLFIYYHLFYNLL